MSSKAPTVETDGGIRDNSVFQVVFPGAVQKVAMSGGSSTQSSAVGANTSVVRLCADIDCYVAFGTNPTASSSTHYLPAKVPEYFGVAGSSKIAALRYSGSDTGNLWITEGSAG